VLPSFFEKPRGDEFNPIRLLYNQKKYKYYQVTTYKDTYQAYLSPDQFKASGRLPFVFDDVLRSFTVEKCFRQLKNHGTGTFISFSTISDHHTIHDWVACKDWLPLTLLYKNVNGHGVKKNVVPIDTIDDYLTIERRWIDDSY